MKICDEPITKAQSDACVRQKGIPTNAVNVRNGYDYLKCDAPPGSHTVSARVPWPYGHLGDRLWVRETWRPQDGMTMECRHADEIEYRATDDRPKEPTDCHWKPSIFMPRWASRITLEITGVRVERLQDISEIDAQAEGANKKFLISVRVGDVGRDERMPNSYRCGYWLLWDSLNKSRGFSWESNPWVWVISFRKAQPAHPVASASDFDEATGLPHHSTPEIEPGA